MNESGQGYEQERPVPHTDGYQPLSAVVPPRQPPQAAPAATAPRPAQSQAPRVEATPAPQHGYQELPRVEAAPPEDVVDFSRGEEIDTAHMTDEERARAEMTPEERERADALEDPLAHPLSKPIEAHGETISILRWKEPTGGDIEKAGNPIAIELEPGSGRYRVSFDEKKMTAMIVQLAQIPPHSVRALRAGDWTAIATKIFRFFA